MKSQIIYLSAALLLTTSTVYAQAHDHSKMMMEAAKPTKADPNSKPAQLSVIKTEQVGNKTRVTIKLMKDGKPLTLNDLKKVHMKKLHVLVIDDTLEDYFHVHPQKLSEAGTYEFEFRPKMKGTYRMWADITPVSTDTQEFVMADVIQAKDTKPEINKTASLESTVKDYTFKLSFDTPTLTSGKAAMGKITVTDKDGKPVKDLQPVMGAYSHIVGFADDFSTIAHMHPMGAEPKVKTDRGGPDLSFQMEAAKPGFTKIFAQVKINGKNIYAPFGVTVQ